MKTLDTFSKRLLVIAFSVSLLLLSVSAFLLTIQRAAASPSAMESIYLVGLGVDDVHLYYAEWNGKNYVIRKFAKSGIKHGFVLP